MKLRADPEVAQWLIEGDWSFQWDAGNSTKSKTSHGFSMGEIESLFLGTFVPAGEVVRVGMLERRWVVFGQTSAGRRATLVFTVRDEGNLLRPISCRAMREDEEAVYEEAIADSE